MKEQTLLKLALSSSLLGLVVLLFISNSQMVEEILLQNLTTTAQDTVVRLRGVVTYVDNGDKLVRLKLSQPENVDILVFKSSNLTLRTGDFLEVIGETSEYKGKPEIIATKLERLG